MSVICAFFFPIFGALILFVGYLRARGGGGGGGMTQAVILEFDDDSGLQVFCHSLRLA